MIVKVFILFVHFLLYIPMLEKCDISKRQREIFMPSFDIVSEVDMQEVDNAVNQAFKGNP